MNPKINVSSRQATPAEFVREPPVNVEPRVFRAPTVGWYRTEVMVPTDDFEYTNAFGDRSSLPRYVHGGWLHLSRPSFSTLDRPRGSAYPDVSLDRVASEGWDVTTDVKGPDRPEVIVTVDELNARADEYREVLRERESKSRDPETVHPDQSGLSAFEDFEKNPSPCPYDEIRSCSCCRCIECGAAGIRARKTKEPTYACNNPACGAEFDAPTVEPDRGE